MHLSIKRNISPTPRRWPPLLIWGAAWTFMIVFDGRLDLANKALVLVLASAGAALWWTPWASLATTGIAVLAFNFAFVPPRGALTVDLHQHALLLVTMLVVGTTISILMNRLRRLAADSLARSERSERLRLLGEQLRTTDQPAIRAERAATAMTRVTGQPVALFLESSPGQAHGPERGMTLIGDATADEQAGLRLCAREGRPMGPGTGRHEEQPAWYLPLRAPQGITGAALLRLGPASDTSREQREHLQAMCALLGTALESARALQEATLAREQARAQALRSTLLAAIAHDHRTPLAAILGAANSLHDQADRLSSGQRQRLAAAIADEATQLARLTDNTLQLARLGEAGVAIRRDWEAVEEMVGTVLQRIRRRHPDVRVRSRVEPTLPLLRCDAVLIVQLLDNLVDNALKHGGRGEPVEVCARRLEETVVIAVRDRGPGIPPEIRERIFVAFTRGGDASAATTGHRAGAGLGLALCLAIAQAHGGVLRFHPRRHGGASFELELPIEEPPQPAATDTPGAVA